MAAVSPVGRASGLEPLSVGADAHTVGVLYEHHSRSVFAYCLSRLGRREDAEDAVQTTFLHAVRGLRRGVVPNVELAWLLGIARNVCLSRRESAARRGRLELVSDPVDLERAPARSGRGEELIGLQDALARLPEKQRQAVLLRDWRGLSYDEVAEQLGVTLANAETLIFRGRRTLAQLLDEQPSATRRRLASLGNVGSLLAWIKSALTGASVAAKVVAAAATVAAVSGTGIAVGTADSATAPKAPATALIPEPRAVVPAVPAPTRVAPRPRPTAAAPAPTSTSTVPAPVGARPTVAAPRPASAPPSPPTSTPSSAPPAAAPPATPPPAHAPAAAAPRHPTEPTAPETPTVQTTVDKVVPPLPVPVPPLPEVVGSLPVPELPIETPPIVEPVVAALPTVTVTLPPIVPVAPITVDPKKLLP